MGTNGNTFTSVTPVAGLNTRTDGIKQDADLVTVRVNYRWGGPVIAKYGVLLLPATKGRPCAGLCVCRRNLNRSELLTAAAKSRKSFFDAFS